MNVDPSVTTYCIVSTFVVSIVGAYTSDSTPLATVNQIFDSVFLAVPTQSLRPRPKWLRVPGPSVAVPTGAATAGLTTAMLTATVPATIKDKNLVLRCT